MSDQVLYTGTRTLPASATWWSSEWGTVGVTNGLAAVVGVGTSFLTTNFVGQQVQFANQPGNIYTISAIATNTALTLTAAFTGATNAATAMGFPANPIFNSDLQSRLKGYVYSSVAPATIQVELSQDGTNFDKVIPLTADGATSPGVYSFDINLLGQPFFRLLVTDAGAGSTVRILLFTYDGGSGSDIIGGSVVPVPVKDATLTPLGVQTITPSNAAVVPITVPAGALYAQISVEASDVRFRDDGTPPTGAVGVLQPVGQAWFYRGSLAALQIIGTALGASTVTLAYYK